MEDKEPRGKNIKASGGVWASEGRRTIEERECESALVEGRRREFGGQRREKHLGKWKGKREENIARGEGEGHWRNVTRNNIWASERGRDGKEHLANGRERTLVEKSTLRQVKG